MKFSTRAVIGGVGAVIVSSAFPALIPLAALSYIGACIYGKDRDEPIEEEYEDQGDYKMEQIVTRRPNNNYLRNNYYQDITPPLNLDVFRSPETEIATRHPYLAARILTRELEASVMESGMDNLTDIVSRSIENADRPKKITMNCRSGRFKFKGKVSIDY